MQDLTEEELKLMNEKLVLQMNENEGKTNMMGGFTDTEVDNMLKGKEEESGIELPIININNFDNLIAGSSGLLNNILNDLVLIYKINTVESDSSKLLRNLIKETLLYMAKSDESKYQKIINFFRTNDEFMKLLNSDDPSPLYDILNSMNINQDIEKQKEE